MRLKAIPAKNRKKLAALHCLSGKFEAGRQYTEAEVNEILDDWTEFHDPATLRREMFNKHLLNLTTDCRAYWKEDVPPLEGHRERKKPRGRLANLSSAGLLCRQRVGMRLIRGRSTRRGSQGSLPGHGR